MQKRQERGCKKERGEYRQVSPWQITRRGEIDVERQGQSEAVCRFSTYPPLLLDKAMATPPIHVDTNLLFPPGPSTCIKVQSFVERRLIILPSDSISLAALLFVLLSLPLDLLRGLDVYRREVQGESSQRFSNRNWILPNFRNFDFDFDWCYLNSCNCIVPLYIEVFTNAHTCICYLKRSICWVCSN